MTNTGPVTVVVPSSGRAAIGCTWRHYPFVVVVVPHTQEATYRDALGGVRVEALPADCPRGVAASRQWCYERFGSVFFLDDQIEGCFRLYAPSGNARLTPDEVYDLIQTTAETASEMGSYLFGFNRWCDPRRFNPQLPLKMSGDCPGWAMGLLRNSRVRFPTEYLIGEDTYASCLNAHYHRHALFDLRFAFRNVGSWATPGGCSAYRTPAMERDNSARLRRAFGRVIEYSGSDKKATPYAVRVVIPF